MRQERLRRFVSGRGLVLLPAAAFLVHQLRYSLAYGSDAGQALTQQGHSYATSFAPWLVLVLAFGAGSFVLRTARAFNGNGDHTRRRAFGEVWGLTTVLLVGIYAVQEFLESVFTVGHPGGLAGIFGHGGWWAIIVAVPVGYAIAALLRAAAAIVEFAAELGARSQLRRRVAASTLHPASAVLVPVAPLARAAAGRAPPAFHGSAIR